MKRFLIIAFVVALSLPIHAAEVPEQLKLGDGVWIWRIEKCMKGDLQAIVAFAKAAHLHHVLIKVHDGHRPRNVKSAAHLRDLLHKNGIKVFAWGYCYGNYPEQEAKYAIDALKSGYDGYVADVESQVCHRADLCRRIGQPVRQYRDAHCRTKVIGFSTFSRVDIGAGADVPVEELVRWYDFGMPQAYWRDFGWSPKYTAHQMCKAWGDRIDPHYVLIPTGHVVYDKKGKAWIIPAAEVAQFMLATESYFGHDLWLLDNLSADQLAMLKEGPKAWLAHHPREAVAKAKPKQVPQKAPQVDKRPTPSIAIEPSAEHRHIPLWKLIAIYGLILWYLIAFCRSYPVVKARNPQTKPWIVAVVSALSAIVLMFKDAGIAIQCIAIVIVIFWRLIWRGTTRPV